MSLQLNGTTGVIGPVNEGLVTATGSTTARNLDDRFADVINVKDFGAVGDGVADDRANIQAAIDLVASRGGGTVLFPFGTYLVGAAIIIKNNVILDLDKSTIRLANGANDDVIRTVDFYSFIGTNNYTNNTPNKFVIQSGVIDGNAANQSPANPDMCNGLALYAYDYILRDLEINNIRGHGIRREWGEFGSFPMESHFENLTITNVWRHGIWDKGPHDSNSDHITIVNASLEQNDTYDGVIVEPWGNGRWFNLHVWSTAPTTNRPRFSFNNNGGRAELVNCHLEGARKQLRSTGNTYIVSSLIYANFSNNPQIELSGDGNIIDSSEYIANSSFPKATVLRLGGDSQFAMSNIDMQIRQKAGGTPFPLIDVVNSAGSNKIDVRVVGHDAAQMLTGAFDDVDEVSIIQEFPNRYTYLQSRQARKFETTNNVRQIDYGSFTPTASFATPGNLSVSYVNRIGRFVRIGNAMHIYINLVFIPTFTTASGDFFISGMQTSENPGVNWPVNLPTYANIDIDAGRFLNGGHINGGQGFITLFQAGDDTFLDPLNVTNFTSGNQVVLSLTATYDVAV